MNGIQCPTDNVRKVADVITNDERRTTKYSEQWRVAL
jgi:hypothetical protein